MPWHQATILLIVPLSFTEGMCIHLTFLASLLCSENKWRWPVINLVLVRLKIPFRSVSSTSFTPLFDRYVFLSPPTHPSLLSIFYSRSALTIVSLDKQSKCDMKRILSIAKNNKSFQMFNYRNDKEKKRRNKIVLSGNLMSVTEIYISNYS